MFDNKNGLADKLFFMQKASVKRYNVFGFDHN